MTYRLGPAAIYSAKTAAAALMALGIGLMVGLPMPFWAMSTAYIVSNPLSGATRSKAIYRVAGTVVGAAMAVAMVPALVNVPALLSLAMALWVGACLAVSLLDRSPRSYMVMLAGYTAALIAFPAVDRPETVFDIAAARVTEIVLGITCATVVHSLVLPRPVSSVLGPRLVAWVASAEAWLRDAMDITPDETRAQDRRQLAVDAVDCAILATHVPFDTSHWREAGASVQALLGRMLSLLPLLSGLGDRRASLGDDPQVVAATKAVNHWLDAGSQAADLPRLTSLLAAGPTPDWPSLLRESFLLRLGQTLTQLAQCRQLLDHLDDPHLPVPSEIVAGSTAMRLTMDRGFAVLSGLSAALAIMLCCTLWIWTGWADGANAAAFTSVFCCLFAALDNPVPAILRFGGAMVGVLPMVGIYLFLILPAVDGFWPMVMVLSPFLVVLGLALMHPRHGLPALSALFGFCGALALQPDFSPDFERFMNNGAAQMVAVVLSAGVTASLRNISSDSAIAGMVAAIRRDLAKLAGARTPPGAEGVVNRAIDQLALLTQRLGAGSQEAETGLREVRMAMNLVAIQFLRAQAPRPARVALSRLLGTAQRFFLRPADTPPPADLLNQIDRALRALGSEPAPASALMAPPLSSEHPHGRAALVALRRNLFPDAPGFVPQPPSPQETA